MIPLPLTRREVTATGLYMMRWKNRTGLVRIVGQPRTGWTLLKTNKDSVEVLMQGTPEDGSIPHDALLSEPLAISVV